LEKIKQDFPKYHLHFEEETNDGRSTATTRHPTWMLDAQRPATDQPPAQDASTSDAHQAICQLIEKEEKEVKISTFMSEYSHATSEHYLRSQKYIIHRPRCFTQRH